MILNKKGVTEIKQLFASVLIVTFLIVLIQAGWIPPSRNYVSVEDTVYVHNLTQNIEGSNGSDFTFAINPEGGQYIYWTNASGRNIVSNSTISSWIFISNPLGNLTVNATRDDQTGFFEIPIKATNISNPSEATTAYVNFTINTTNDNPAFTNLNSTYTISEPVNQLIFVNASDEESQYPLNFSIVFTSCAHANWSTRGEGNCSLFDLTYLDSNTSTLINFTPSRNDVGEYNLTFYVNDSGANYPCPHDYCANSTYKQNKFTSQIVTFRILSSFDINISDCNNTFVNEGSALNCAINITTTDLSENLSAWSNASLRNYAGNIFNQSWFYYNASNHTSSQSIISIPISVIPGRTEVGNWTINFSAQDSNGAIKSENIFVFVNKTVTDSPELSSISDMNLSIGLFNYTELNITDSDLLIPDKNESFGGYNESISLTLELLNRTGLSVISIPSNLFNISLNSDGNLLDNKTSAKINFFFNASHPGDYTVRVNASDKENHLDSTLFNLSVINNTAPQWNNSKDYTLNFTVNSTRATTTGEIFADLVSEEWVTDLESNPLSFSAVESMNYFSLTSEGIINFTPYKEDVGIKEVTVYVTDSLGLSSSEVFTFNITNTNTEPIINSQNNLLVNELDTLSSVNLTIEVFDDDLLIEDASFVDLLNFSWEVLYQSNQSVAPLILNWTSPHTVDNESSYSIVSFIPTRADIGNYTVIINVTDESGASDEINFNLNISQFYDTPLINYPPAEFVWNLTENETFSLIFNANHSATNKNLTYLFYIHDSLRGNISSFGNGTNATWSFTPNFTDETYGNLTNLTLTVSNPYESASRNFSVNISHTNAPINFTQEIPDKHNETGETIAIDLTEHFSDVDAFDEFYNQTVNFTVTGNTTPSKFTWQINNWSLIFSSSVVGLEQFNITSEDLNSVDNSTLTSAISNSFVIEFEEQDTEVIPEPEPSGGGSGGSSPSTCVPSWNAAIGLCINGFRNITYWDSKKCFTNFTDNASCDDPGTILQKLVFTEELITVEHPECIEALEAVREAENLINQGQLKEASTKLDGVVNWCRNSIAQSSEAAFTRDNEEPQRGLVWWVAVIFSISLFLEIIYYFIYRKVRLRRIANTKI